MPINIWLFVVCAEQKQRLCINLHMSVTIKASNFITHEKNNNFDKLKVWIRSTQLTKTLIILTRISGCLNDYDKTLQIMSYFSPCITMQVSILLFLVPFSILT